MTKQFFLLLLKFFDRHLVFGDDIRVLGEELFGLRLEYFPRWIGDDGVKATAHIHHFIELITPVEGSQGVDICYRQGSLFGFALLILQSIPCGLLKLDFQLAEFIQQDAIQHLVGAFPMRFNRLAQRG